MNNDGDLLKQIEERINKIEKYPNTDHFSKKDYILVIFVVSICLLIVILGAYL